MNKPHRVRFIDLFAGLGGTRLGLEQALNDFGVDGECVFTSEIKPYAIMAHNKNFEKEKIHGDITKVHESDIPDFDILLAGFPCQPFSSAGSRRGFMDTRGTLFFDIERILKAKMPDGFLLENVEGLKTHDRVDPGKPIGRTLETIIRRLEALGYSVVWKIIDASQHGVPQKRKRIYIIGSKAGEPSLEEIPCKSSKLADVLEKSTELSKDVYINSYFTKKLLQHYSVDDIIGKHIKDKRGGKNNIHSWDIELKGRISFEQKKLIEEILKQRRRKQWAEKKGIPWADGMPLTLNEISTFYTYVSDKKQLKKMLDDMVEKGYLAYERPKKAPDWYKDRGYNIVAGKLSFEISHILNPNKPAPTLVATDVTRLAVVDDVGIRRLTVREGLRLFGFPESYKLDGVVRYQEAFDLLGNSVSVDVVKLVSQRLLRSIHE